jgi:hypothetical protein
VVTAAMSAARVRRLVLLSAFGAGSTISAASPMARGVFGTAMRSVYRDKEVAESRLATSGLDVTTVYPVVLTNGPSNDSDVVRDAATVARISGLPKVSRATVAKAMLDAVEDAGSAGRRLIVTRAGTVR